MRVLGNILWHFPFCGFVFALSYALCGLLFCVTIIGIPVGLGFFQFSLFLLTPFSSSMVDRRDVDLLNGGPGEGMTTFAMVSRVLYFPFGVLSVVNAVILVAVECISLIGIPCGIVWARSLKTVFNPVNKVCVPREVGDEIERRKRENTLGQYVASASAVTDEYIESAQRRSDDELKAILQSRDDYNVRLVKAAEQVLLSRTTGIEIPREAVRPLVSGYAVGAKEVGQISGEMMIMIGGLIPSISFVFSLLQTLIMWVCENPTTEFYKIVMYSTNGLGMFLDVVSIGLLVAGFLQVKDRYNPKARVGMVLLPVAMFLTFVGGICNMWGLYLNFEHSVAGGGNVYFTLGTVLNYLYELVFCAGILIWGFCAKDKELNMAGVYLICGTLVAMGLSALLLNLFLYPYLLDNELTRCLSWIYLLRGFLFLALSVWGWCLFVGRKFKK